MKTNPALGVSSMVLGIVAIVTGCCFVYVSVPCALVGLILGILVVAKKMTAGYRMAVAGIICSAVALLLIVAVIVAASFLYGSMVHALTYIMRDALHMLPGLMEQIPSEFLPEMEEFLQSMPEINIQIN